MKSSASEPGLRDSSRLHLTFVAFCLLSVICKQQLKQSNYSVDQSGLLTGFWTYFTSSVWTFCRWVADVPPRETSPAATSVEKRMFSQAIVSAVWKALWFFKVLITYGATEFIFKSIDYRGCHNVNAFLSSQMRVQLRFSLSKRAKYPLAWILGG